jgi:DNA-binding NarL/FixJ family response regulator
MRPLRTIIIDDERFACERLKKLLLPFKNIQLIDYFTNGLKGVEAIIKNKPDLLFLDVELENSISAFDIISQIDNIPERPHIVLVTGYPQYSIKAIKHNVFDYLLKPVDVDELEDTISRLINQIDIFSNSILKEFEYLSNREKEVLKCVVQGKRTNEIAEQLYLSVNTVNTHRRNILKKTGCRSLIDLIRLNSQSHE